MLTLGATLKTVRKVSLLTQAELAAKLGCAPRSIRRYEADKSVPSLKVIHGYLALRDFEADRSQIMQAYIFKRKLGAKGLQALIMNGLRNFPMGGF